jgi:hypothetical protein
MAMSTRNRPRTVTVDLLALDLNSCGRCVGSLNNIEEAVEIVRPALDASGIQLRLRKIIVNSESEARKHKFVSSPTIRINGQDLDFETFESHCESCTDLSGCDEGTDCRAWRYRGEEYTEAPVGLVVEAILGELFGSRDDSVSDEPAYGGVPDNLRRFFDNKPAARTVCCGEPGPLTGGCC